MKTKYLLIIGLLVMLGANFINWNEKPAEIPVISQDSSAKTLPTPDVLWEKQQQKIDESIGTHILEPEMVQRITVNEIDKDKQNVNVTKPLPTPDELWEKLHNSEDQANSDLLPGNTPVIPVISQEQMQAEAEAKMNAQNGYIETGGALLPDDPTNLGYVTEGDELPPSEDFLEVMSYEMIESEAASKILYAQSKESVFQEPLRDPQTGLSDQELMNYQSDVPAIESELPVDEINVKGE